MNYVFYTFKEADRRVLIKTISEYLKLMLNFEQVFLEISMNRSKAFKRASI